MESDNLVLDRKRKRVDQDLVGGKDGLAGSKNSSKYLSQKTCKWQVLGSRPTSYYDSYTVKLSWAGQPINSSISS